ncbi:MULTISPECIES: Crp/Fnr family transcriptional regulator [unclassified Polaribacter]|uniref:Crp/Fnr family transcriptional regulator n=1 Tax=unclassified Polaribacter TaxID=196858 RepID=UPI0011BEB1ED|nr:MULTISPECIES: cyclic nucleotide-binding domain-containing protein [unclassified Polaribacter]TXD51980.1 Crp/Fnr family transcriptional regulator [Polaribacter sp. IC063]TXD58649.1 Crp/Fnr family transcriptional regulator [Polaribacter sp. IC066]
MKEQIKNIHQVISSFIEISNEEWVNYSSMFKTKEIKKKEIILQEGNICKDVFFINKGVLRFYFVDNNGEEKTFHFAIENTFATDYKSFLKQIPSNYSIQALEDTQVVTMSLDMLLSGYEILKNGEKLGRLLAEEYFFMFNDKIQAIYTQTPLDRYNNLTTNFPEIFQRVPQHLIASYLTISSVHLSRLKNAH